MDKKISDEATVKSDGGDASYMTVRQWYKGQVATGIHSSKEIMVAYRKAAEDLGLGVNEVIAKSCGEVADALIAEDEEFKKRNGKEK